jgi:hypothetical protein
LNRDDRRLVLEAAIVLAVVWVGLWVLSFARVRGLIDRYAHQPRVSLDQARPAVGRIGWAVSAVAHRSPVPMTCLRQALAADAILRRRGFVSQLRFGVQLHRNNSFRSLEAHAWVECEGAIVVGDIKELADYLVLAAPDRS